jgi:hypothetical protein
MQGNWVITQLAGQWSLSPFSWAGEPLTLLPWRGRGYKGQERSYIGADNLPRQGDYTAGQGFARFCPLPPVLDGIGQPRPEAKRGPNLGLAEGSLPPGGRRWTGGRWRLLGSGEVGLHQQAGGETGKGRSYTGWLIDLPRGYIRWQWSSESLALPLKAAGLE